MLAIAMVIAIVSGTIAYWYLRNQFVSKTQTQLIQFLPPENCLTWRIPTKRTEVPDYTRPASEKDNGIGDASNVPPIHFPEHSAHSFDPKTIDWMTALTLSAAALDGLVQTAPHIAEFDALNLETLKHIGAKTAELVSKIESFDAHIGHFMIAAEHGHEAWLGALAAFLSKHMIFSSFEHAVAAKAAMAEMNLHAAASAVEAHHGTAEGILHGASGEHVGFFADAHFPVITVLFSSYREFQLLTDDKTTLLRAAKNVAVDGAAVAGGGFAGAKLGALAGAFGGPVGILFGGIVGGIAGAVGGKAIASNVRVSGFESAKNSYITTSEKAKTVIDSLIELSQIEAKQLQESGTKEFEQGRILLIQQAQTKLSEEIGRCESRVHELTEVFPQRLAELARQLEAERLSLLANLPRTSFGFLWPDRSDVMRGLADRWFQHATELIVNEMSRYRDLPDRSTHGRAAEIKRFLTEYHFQLDQLDHDIQEVVDTFASATRQTKVIESSVVKDVESLRRRLVNNFTLAVSKIMDSIGKETKKKKEELQPLWQTLKIEADAVGIHLTAEHG